MSPSAVALTFPFGGKSNSVCLSKTPFKKSTIDEKMIGEVTAYLCTVGLFIGGLGGGVAKFIMM